MPNLSAPKGNRFKGWFYDQVNNQLEYWFNGTKVGGIDANGQDITNDTTTYMSNGVVATAGNTSLTAALTSVQKHFVQFSAAALASNGAGATLAGLSWTPTANAVIDRVVALNAVAADVTVGTATSSASYRRVNIICNTASAGTGTDIVASLNATASAGAGATRGFTIAASTVPAYAVVRGSQLTVGAETADGTDAAVRQYTIEYHYV